MQLYYRINQLRANGDATQAVLVKYSGRKEEDFAIKKKFHNQKSFVHLYYQLSSSKLYEIDLKRYLRVRVIDITQISDKNKCITKNWFLSDKPLRGLNILFDEFKDVYF